jgi:mannose-6-phosphate isomerase-like protein (cupin superfamily)
MRSQYSDARPFQTKDGSEIRELMRPERHGNRNQSLAEAIVYPGQETVLHKHLRSEELYHVTAGTGWMTLGEEKFEVRAGDTVGIMPGTPHCIQNSGNVPLKILCCCSPPYSHDDTILLTGPAGASQA